MKKVICNSVCRLGLLLLLGMPLVAVAQPAPVPYHMQAYTFHSGLHNADPGGAPLVAFSDVVRVAEAPWLRLHFGDWDLGKASYLVITSREDGAQQRLDAVRLAQWQSASAFFNGDEVEIELYVAPGDQGVFFELREVMVGEKVSEADLHGETESICGAVDDRVDSTDPAAGRIVPVGCTGWIISNGAFLTAGHCVGASLQTLQFNVPPSDANGTINHPGTEDQYPIEALANIESSTGFGDDWGVFNAFANSNGELASKRQGAFYRMSRDSNPATVRITGYGVDGPPPNFGNPPPRNADSQTEQTDAGPSAGETVISPDNAFWSYAVDTQGGNSGSPIIVDASNLTLGIHTHGGCTAGGGTNNGTSFENDDLEAAVQTNPGASTVYSDMGHDVVLEDGTIFRPYDTVLEAVDAAPPGGVVSIVTGFYDGETMEITKPLTIVVPVGGVVIGN